MSKFTVFIKQYAKKHKFWWDLEVLIRWTLHFPMRPQKRSCEKPHSNKTDTDRLSLSCDITNLVCPDYFHTSLKMRRLKRYKAHTCYKRSTYWWHAISVLIEISLSAHLLQNDSFIKRYFDKMWSMRCGYHISHLPSMLQMLLMRFWIHSILKESRNKVKDFVLVWRYNLCKSLADGNQDRRSVVEKEETDQVMGQI